MAAEPSRSGPLGTIIVTAGTVLVAIALIDFLSNVFPMAPGLVEWRYAAVGMAAGFISTPLLGLALMMFGAELKGSRAFLKGAGAVAWVLAIVMVLSLVVFALDGLQVRQANDPASQNRVTAGVGIVALKLLGGAIAFALLGRAALQLGKTARTKSAPDSSPVVGR